MNYGSNLNRSLSSVSLRFFLLNTVFITLTYPYTAPPSSNSDTPHTTPTIDMITLLTTDEGLDSITACQHKYKLCL